MNIRTLYIVVKRLVYWRDMIYLIYLINIFTLTTELQECNQLYLFLVSGKSKDKMFGPIFVFSPAHYTN